MKKIPAFFLRIFIILFLSNLFIINALSQVRNDDYEQRMQWFNDAKLGIFIHWGIYAVNGIDESWSFYNGYISYNDYMKQLSGFTASQYNANQWVDLIKESGARYAVLTTKHHDGVALWNTKQNDLNVIKKTPAARDLITPFCEAMHKQNLKVGLYYSLLDWSHDDYPAQTRKINRYTNDSLRFERFVKFDFAQIDELMLNFKPDLLWFDGDWDFDATHWHAADLVKAIRNRNPSIVLNNRIAGLGDYETPEITLPVVPPARKWEQCTTINDSWGWQPNDQNYKSANQVIRMFIDCISLGGNLLLDISPKADGTLPQPQIDVLKELGRWTKKHYQAVYETNAGIPFGHYHGATTLSKDSTILYLFVEGNPNGPLVVKGLKNTVHRAWIVGNATKVKTKVIGKPYWSSIPGLLYIDVPEPALDPQVTVVAVLLDGKIKLHREK